VRPRGGRKPCCLITLTEIFALTSYVLWVLDVAPRLRRRIAVLAVVAFVATVVAHQIKVASFPPEDAGFSGRP
jgi:hypothetical protein